MSILSKEELQKRLKEKFGDSTDDNDLSFIEDITDTYDSLSNDSVAQELETMKQKYSDLHQKYRDRFFNKGAEVDDEPEVEKPKVLRFEDLFKEN